MPDASQSLDKLETDVAGVVGNLGERMPGIALAIVILLLGWFVARTVRAGTRRFLSLLNRVLDRQLAGPRSGMHFSPEISELFAGILYWITLLIFLTLALDSVGMPGFSDWLHQVVGYLPVIVTGAIVILLGYILSVVVKELTLAAARTAHLDEATAISRLAQIATQVTAAMIGLELMGIDITFLTTILGVSVAAVLAGFALAFGLGARTLVSNLIGAHYLRGSVEPGQNIKVGDLQGMVLEVSATALILDTAEGRTTIPAKLLQEQPVVILVGENADAGDS